MINSATTDSAMTETTCQNNVALAVLTTLRNYGIDTVFGIPGTHNLELYRALPRLGIRAVTNRHEQGSGYGADGWSLQTGLPGVVITTSGPGLLNALSSVATAYAESRPMIVLTPGPPPGEEFANRGALHETKDSQAAAEAVAEWSRRVSSAPEAVRAVHEAFELFRTGRPRPVVIEIPLDVLEAPIDLGQLDLGARPLPAARRAPEDQVQEAARLLSSATSPVIVYGGGSLGAGHRLVTLAELADAPVVTTLNGRAAIPETHPLSLGAALRLKTAQAVVNAADVLIVVGSKVGEAELWWGPLSPSGVVVRIDRLQSQLHKNLPAQVGIAADAEAVVDQLIEALTPLDRKERRVSGARRAAEVRTAIEAESRDWSPAVVAVSEAIAAALPDDVILGADSSQICYYGTANHIPLARRNSYLYMATYATLGYGLPASIGAGIADDSRPVVCVVGDGALMFSIQELVTAVEQRLDLVVVVVDNGGYKEIEENEASVGIAPIGVRLTQPDWAALAQAFGATGRRIASPGELEPAVAAAVSAGGVQLVHVPLALFSEEATR